MGNVDDRVSAFKSDDFAQAPFSFAKLDGYLDAAGLDVVLVSTKHNINYLTGGYRFFFFAHVDAAATSRYLPFIIYERGKPENTVYIANRHEPTAIRDFGLEQGGFWIPNVTATTHGIKDAAALALKHLEKIGATGKRIGAELAFLPAEADRLFRAALPNPLADALRPLERLRTIKSPREIAYLEKASEGVVDSMVEVMTTHGAGATKWWLAEAMQRAIVGRGLDFEYCFVNLGASLDRSPSNAAWKEGEIIALDSGGLYKGYIGDLCRMGVLGEPDAELQDLLGEVQTIQDIGRKLIRPGTIGREVYAAGHAAAQKSRHAKYLRFIAHGMGLVAHEPPRITSESVPYPADEENDPLQPGMVLSVETTMQHPRRGFIKLEDTVVVTPEGSRGLGDQGRGWNIGGSRKA